MPDPNPADRTINDAAMRLEAALEALQTEYDQLERLGNERLEAMRRADLGAVAESIGAESQIASRIAELDRQRAEAAGDLGELLGVGENERTATTLAQRAAGKVGDAVSEAALRLREVIERVQRQNARARLAAQTLAAHMEGVLRTAHSGLNHSGSYGSRGVVSPGPAVVSALDLTS